MSMINNELITRFDYLPTEIIYMIFDYLSSIDILKTFFNLNQRFNNILLTNTGLLNYFKFSTIDLNIWNDTLLVIGSHIKYLNIDSFDLSIPLDIFTNLKSLIISSLLSLSDETIKLIFEINQFNNLHLLKINQKKIFFDEIQENYLNNQDYILKKIFNSYNSLKNFQYSSILPSFIVLGINRFQINEHLSSLTLTLTDFEDIFPLISLTPNLKDLNIHSLLTFIPSRLINYIYIKLKKLSLTFGYKQTYSNRRSSQIIDFNSLINIIKQFSLSLTYLSLNLVHTKIEFDNLNPHQFFMLEHKFLLYMKQITDFLRSMGQLKQFHFYGKISHYGINKYHLRSNVHNQYWIDRKWSFGMHDDYFYTLPFHFDYIYNFPIQFDIIKLFNEEVLQSNVRLWYHVKSIELYSENDYNFNFLQELSIQMPNLTFITFNSTDSNYFKKKKNTNINKDMKNENYLILNTIKKIEFTEDSLENRKEWLSYLTPNLKHLILSSFILPSIDNPLIEISNNKIEQLDIDDDDYFQCEQLINAKYNYFSNVQVIHFCLKNRYYKFQWYADIIMNIFKNFKNLKLLIVYIPSLSIFHGKHLTKIVELINMDEILQNYHIKHFPQYFLFSKKLL